MQSHSEVLAGLGLQHVKLAGTQFNLEKVMATHSSTLPGKSHGRRSLEGCSPWGCEESDTTE